jgi:hypothetical protein
MMLLLRYFHCQIVLHILLSSRSIFISDLLDSLSCLQTHRFLVPSTYLQNRRNDTGSWSGGHSAAAKHKHGNGSAETLWLDNLRDKRARVSRSYMPDISVSNNSLHIACVRG